MYKIGIHGATGRVGKNLVKSVNNDKELELSYAYSRSGNNDLSELCGSSDAIIDFSYKDSLENLLDAALENEVPLVIGTTGYSDEQKEKIIETSKKIAILYSPNMTLGIHVISKILKEHAALFKQYDIDIIETHHRNKKDSPSGTALMLGNLVGEEVGKNFDNYHSLRSGTGGYSDHEIIFANKYERVKLTHQIINPEIFAEYAITCAKWLLKEKKTPSLYSISDAV